MKSSKLITKIIVFAMIIFAIISLLDLRGRIEAVDQERLEARRLVAEMELSNAELEYVVDQVNAMNEELMEARKLDSDVDRPNVELEYKIYNNNSEIIASIARSRLGLVLPGEIVFYDARSGQGASD